MNVHKLMRMVFVSAALVLLLLRSAVAQVHDVLAHASSDRAWVAKITRQDSTAGPIEQTDLIVRQSGPGERWKTLATVPARVVALACRSSQLVILQGNGDWKTIWSNDGGASGDPLPGGGRIRAISDDGEDLWAVGSVRGGMPSATQSATEPTTNPSTAAADLPYKLVLFQQVSGGWKALADVPEALDSAGSTAGHLSLAVIGGKAVVATSSQKSAVHIMRWSEGKGWEDLGDVSGDGKIADFELVSEGTSGVLWTSSGKGLGRIDHLGDGSGAGADLKWMGANTPESPPSITFYGGYLRLVGLSGGRIFEQRYEADGSPVGSAAELSVPTNLNDSRLHDWLNGALIVALGFSVLATLYRRGLARRRMTVLTPPAPAPMLLRGVAGFIDLLPFLVTLAIVTARQDKSLDPQERLEDLPALIATGISIVVYLLHTTLSEVFTARTIGKWLFGLRVVTVDGGKPSFLQLVVRNILRVLDLLWFPLVLVLLTPLRQRSADIAAGTMVIRPDVNAARKETSDVEDEAKR